MKYTDKEMYGQMREALERSGGIYSIEDIGEYCSLGHMNWHQHGCGVCVTEVQQYPRKRVLEVIVAFGDFDDILKCCETVYHLGKIEKCDHIEWPNGRPGWKKVLSRLGAKITGVNYRLNIKE